MNSTLLGPLFLDEPAWSGVSRFLARHPRLTERKLENMLGLPILRTTFFAFPISLRCWAQLFGYGDNWRPFLEEHTFWPWVKPFLHPARCVLIQRELKEASSPHPSQYSRNHSLIEFCELALADVLRPCPTCFRKDVAEFGVPYWHLVHQFAGLHKCPHHDESLLTTKVRMPSSGGAWHYTALRRSHLDRSNVTIPADGLQHFLAGNILKIKEWRSCLGIGGRMRIALWNAGLPVGCTDNTDIVLLATQRRLGSSAFEAARELEGWRRVLFGRPSATPVHFLVVSYLLRTSPSRLATSPHGGSNGSRMTRCVAESIPLQRRRSHSYHRLIGTTMVQHHRLFCAECWERLSNAHPQLTRHVRKPISLWPDPFATGR